MSSIPLAAPWNGADKNLGRLIAQTDTGNQYLLQTGLEDRWPAHVIPIRSRRAGAMPTHAQKINEFGALLRYSREVEMVHMIASLNQPSRLASRLLKGWRKIAGRPILHTIPSLGDTQLDPSIFFGDVTVVVSEDSRQKLVAQGVQNVVRISPPLDIRLLRPKPESEPWVQSLELGPQAILYSAHYQPDSGIQEMIQAFAGLPAALSHTVLVFACRAQLGQDAEAEARRVRLFAEQAGVSERVRVLGNVADMPALISACALTVLVPKKLASKMDLPLVILESLALQRPVIVSDRTPMTEALLGGGGFAVPFGEPRALAQAISRLLLDKPVYQALAAQGYEAVQRECNPEKVIEQYQAIYHQFCRK